MKCKKCGKESVPSWNPFYCDACCGTNNPTSKVPREESMPTELAGLDTNSPGYIGSGKPTRRARGTSQKAVANATLSAVQKIYPVLVALDAEQRKRALSAVAVLLDDGTP